MTIEELYNTLLQLDQEATLLHAPWNPHSYRGYYDCLSFDLLGVDTTVGQFRKLLLECVGETYTGYKGGDFTMRKDTDVYIAPYGCTGRSVQGVLVTNNGVSIYCEGD